MNNQEESYIMHDDEDIKIYTGREDNGGMDGAQRQKRQARQAPPRQRRAEPEKKKSRSPSKASHKRDARECRETGGKDYFLLAAAVAVLVLANFMPYTGWLRLLIFLVPYLIAGFDGIMDALEQLFNREYFRKEQLSAAASIAAFAIGAYTEAVVVMLLLRVGWLFESYAVKRSRKLMAEIMSIRPENANVETSEGVLAVSPDYVNKGDIIAVGPGERIPVDGVIIEGISTIDASPISGDSEPEAVTAGFRAVSGCINITSPIRIRAERRYEDSTVSRILAMVEAAPDYTSNQEMQVKRFGRIFTPLVVLLALALAVVPPIFNGQWLEYVKRAAVLLLVACPGALSLSIPLSYYMGLCCSVKNGALAKGSCFFEALANADTVVFGKTGIITEGRFAITDVYPEGMSEYELLSIAATAEKYSMHPIAAALRAASRGLELPPGAQVQAEDIPGRGVAADIGGRRVLVGNAAMLEENGIGYKVPSRAGAAIHVAMDGRYCGHILVADRIRRSSFDALENLRVQGIRKTVMLTGDVLSVARPIASKLNFDMLKAELRPEEKISALEYLINNKGGLGTVAFVGDGLYDAQAMARADVGIAMDALDSEAAMEAADIFIMDDNIRRLPKTVKAARFTYNAVKINIWAVVCVKLALLVLGVLGLVPVFAAAAADTAVFAACMVNSLSPLKIWKE